MAITLIMSNQALQAEDIIIPVQGRRFVGQLWGRGNALPVIALHGWLDNCRSFELLAPLLQDAEVLALDMAGHGHSDHRSADASYHIWDDVREVLLIADYMGWEHFVLLGHSRGGIIAVMTAAIAPGRVRALVLVEGFWPQTMTAESAPQQLSRFINQFLAHQRAAHGDATRGHENLDVMVRARCRGGFAISEAAARRLVERNVMLQQGLYVWRTDPRLLMPSPLMLTDDEAAAFLAAVHCRSLLLIARDALGKNMEALGQRLASCPGFGVMILDGGHHLHMENPPVVADAINPFLKQVMAS